jgi:hypothetical protein
MSFRSITENRSTRQRRKRQSQTHWPGSKLGQRSDRFPFDAGQMMANKQNTKKSTTNDKSISNFDKALDLLSIIIILDRFEHIVKQAIKCTALVWP